MLDQLAAECRRWTAGLDVELALVIPIDGAGPRPALAVARGTRSAVAMPPHAVLRAVLAGGTADFAVAHNHVTPVPPGSSDLAVTRRLVAAAAVVGLHLRAHVVVTPTGWYDCLDDVLALHPWGAAAAA